MTCPILALQAGDDQNITAEDNAAFDAGARGRRGRARGGHLRRSAAQLLRPQVRGVRRRVRRRVAADARVHRAPLVILAIDQGTTGTTCLVVDEALEVAGRAYRELPQHFPQPGWVEHDPEEIWAERARGGGRRLWTTPALAAADLDAIGITNQRETTVLWERATGRRGRAARSSGRTGAPPSAAASSTPS